jgi:hypothetical protein
VSGSGQYFVREGDIIAPQGANWEGSLGYIVRPGLAVTNKHVVPDVGMVVQHKRRPWGEGVVIGLAIKTVTWVKTSFWDWLLYILFGRPLPGNKVDATLVALKENVVAKPAFDLPRKIVEPKVGDKLYKRGRTTGETVGEIIADKVDIWVDMGNGVTLLFTDVYQFSNKTLPGDSGGPNYTPEGIVGITFAGPESGEYGFGIKAKNIAEVFGLE